MGYLTTRGARLVSRGLFLRLCLFISLLLIAPFPGKSLAATSRTVDSTGVAVIHGGNTALARDAAISDALRKAVEQTVGSLVSSDTLVENSELISDSIYTKTDGFVRNYTILSEGTVSGHYQVNVRAEVATGDIKEALDAAGLLIRRAERPRVLFMVSEKPVNEAAYSSWWTSRRDGVYMPASESALRELFISKGFSVVEPKTVEEGLPSEGRDAAIAAGKNLSAEVVVFGKAASEEGPRIEGSAIGTYLAEATLESVRVDDGTVLGSARGNGVARHISASTGSANALSNASRDAGGKLIEQMLSKWAGAQTVTIKLSGLKDYALATGFKNLLKTRVRGIEAVYQRRFEGNEAFYEVETDATAQTIADDISRAGGYQVIKTTDASVEVLAIEKEEPTKDSR